MNVEFQLAENKRLLVAARRAGDEERARELSQEKERLKRKGRRMDPFRRQKAMQVRRRPVLGIGKPSYRKDGELRTVKGQSRDMVCVCGRPKSYGARLCGDCRGFKRWLRGVASMAAMIMLLGTLICQGQPVPTNGPATAPNLPRLTNTFRADGYTMSWQPGATQALVDADSGVVGYSMNGTNAELVSGTRPSFNNGQIYGTVEDTNVVLEWYQWDTSSVMWSSDLTEWQVITVTNLSHYSASVPKEQQGFFEKP